MTVGGMPAAVEYAGIAPGTVALYQVNVRVPPGVSSGNQDVLLTYEGLTAKTVVDIPRRPS